MKKTILLASHNANKTKEYREILGDSPYTIIDLNDIDFQLEIDEKYDTYRENAMVKVEALEGVFDGIIIGDDSGFEVSALDFKPGVHSARFLADQSYDIKNQYIIDHVKDHEDRSCAFVCALTCLYQDKLWVSENRCFGTIATQIYPGHGFGYDPIFIPLGYDLPFSVLDQAIKNDISHRALAIKALVHYLEHLE